VRTARGLAEADVAGPIGRAGRILVGDADAQLATRCAVAAAISLAATLGGVLLRGELQGYRVLLYFAAICLAAIRGGAGPGLLALALCAVAYRTDAVGLVARTWLDEADPLRRLVFFAGFAALGVWASSALREGYLHLHARRRRAERRAYGHRIAAELGVRALGESDLDALLGETLWAVQHALRCDAVTLLELLPDGSTLKLRGVAGIGRELLGRAFGPSDAPLAFHVLSTRELAVVDDLAAEPALASPLLLQHGITASLAAPVLASGPAGQSFGVIAAHHRGRSRLHFTAEDASFLQGAANVVGTAVVRLRAEERVREALASERFLADASRQLALSIDWHETLGRVAKLAVPFLGDWCLVVVVGPDGRPRSVVAEAADPARASAVRELLERYPIDPAAAHGVGRILRTGAPEIMPEATPEAFVTQQGPPGVVGLADAVVRREILARVGLRSYLGAPLTAGDRILGAIAFGIAEGPRRFLPQDLALAEALAQRCAMALENADLYRAAQQATRVREEVLAVVSHDLKMPLGALLLGSQMVERLAPPGRDGDDLRRAAGTVRRTAERMGRLIHDLVDVASIDAGRLSVHLAEHDANAIAREALDGAEAVAADRGVAIALSIRGEGPAAVPCDRDRMLQVLANLLSNAVQVSQPGARVGLEVAREPGEVVFTVRDAGPGIPAEDLPHVFEQWYRGAHARYPGSGLGLAIARAIVEAHHGRIWARSVEGEGSAFSFALPAAQPPDESIHGESERREGDSTDEGRSTDGGGSGPRGAVGGDTSAHAN
jgi:signal transduction histidine kinase